MPSKKKSKTGEDCVVNLTPMIDVVFQLIIFFVVTVNLDQEQMNQSIKLPDSKYSREEKEKDPRQITIQVDSDGRVFIGKAPYSIKGLRIVLKNTVRMFGADNVPILIRGDKQSKHAHIRKVMDLCAGLGMYKIKFAGLKQEAEKRKAP